MKSTTTISPSSVHLLSKLKNHLLSTGQTLQQLLKRQKIQKINLPQFYKILSFLQITNLSIEPQQIFSQLSQNNQHINIQLIKRLILTIQQINKQKINNKQYKNKQLQQLQQQNKIHKDQIQINLKNIKICLFKIKQFIKKEENIEEYVGLFKEEDGINRVGFNRLLVSMELDCLKNKRIRKMIIQDMFNYYEKSYISCEEILFRYCQKKQLLRKPIFQPDSQQHLKIMIKQRSKSKNTPFSPPKKVVQSKKPRIFKYQKNSFQNSIPQQSQQLKPTKSKLQLRYNSASTYYNLQHTNSIQYGLMQQFQNLISTKTKFIDNQNPLSQGQYIQADKIFKNLFDNSEYYLFEEAQSVIHRQKSRIQSIARLIQPKDIIQGKVADCYFLSSIASIISIYPEIIHQKFIFNKNPANLYAVKLFIDGQWKITVTDHQFPCKNLEPLYAYPHTRQIWVMILEKCWAKIFGSYLAIGQGSPKQGFMALTGAPYEIIKFKQNQEDKQMIKKRLQICKQEGHVATVSGSKKLQELSSQSQQSIGLISGHAYSLLKMTKIENEVLVKLRNPWGRITWKGDWSFSSSKWSNKLRSQLNYIVQPQDGSFYMPFDLFCKYFGEIVICKVNPFYKHNKIRIKTNKKKSAYISLSIKTSGHYYISIYQESKRKFTANQYINYKYSPSRLILMKKQGNKYKYIGSRAYFKYQVCTLDCSFLEQGEYVISAKIWWTFWDDHEMVVTSYGIEHTDLMFIQNKNAEQFKKNLIQSYAQKYSGTGKIKKYEKYKIDACCQTNFNMQTGIGFIKIKNNSEKTLQCIQEMKLTAGLKLIKPGKLPLVFKLIKGQQKVYGFFVVPSGYQYTTTEKLIIY